MSLFTTQIKTTTIIIMHIDKYIYLYDNYYFGDLFGFEMP